MQRSIKGTDRYLPSKMPAITGINNRTKGAERQYFFPYRRIAKPNKKQPVFAEPAVQSGINTRYKYPCLFTEVHTSFLVQGTEVWITQVFDEADGFAGALHFGSEFFVYAGEFIETENRLFDGVTF